MWPLKADYWWSAGGRREAENEEHLVWPWEQNVNRTFLSIEVVFIMFQDNISFLLFKCWRVIKKKLKKKSFTRVPGHVRGGNTLKPPLWSVFNFEVILKHDFCFFSLFSYKIFFGRTSGSFSVTLISSGAASTRSEPVSLASHSIWELFGPREHSVTSTCEDICSWALQLHEI